MINLYLPVVFVCVSLGALAQSRQDPSVELPINEKEVVLSTIAQSSKQGVTVCVNQLQVQRIGTHVELVKHVKQFGIDGEKFARTIAISISKKNSGKSSGPIALTLKDGTKLTPMLFGNQKYMSALANSSTENGFDFEENWFELPVDTAFEQIFPVSVSYQCTDEAENTVQFEFKKIYP